MLTIIGVTALSRKDRISGLAVEASHADAAVQAKTGDPSRGWRDLRDASTQPLSKGKKSHSPLYPWEVEFLTQVLRLRFPECYLSKKIFNNYDGCRKTS